MTDSKKKKIIIGSCIGVLALVLVFVLSIFIRLQGNGFPNGAKLSVTNDEAGLKVQWPTIEMVDGYNVKVTYVPDGGLSNPGSKMELINQDVTGQDMMLPMDVVGGKDIEIKVSTIKKVRVFGQAISKAGKNKLVTVFCPDMVEDYAVKAEVDREKKTIVFDIESNPEYTYSVVLTKPEKKVLATATSNGSDRQKIEVQYDNPNLPIPELGVTYEVKIEAKKSGDKMEYTDLNYCPLSLERDDFLDDTVKLDVEELGDNQYKLTWNEAKGDGYLLEEYSEVEDKWKQVKEYSKSDEREFSTGVLKACTVYKYRVTATHSPEPEKAVAEKEIITDVSVDFATVWPTKDLPLYKEAKADAANQIGIVRCVEALTVLEEKSNMFRVRTSVDGEFQEGYIDSNCCMINLPDYIGELCMYDITNSYASIYLAHEYAIPSVSGTVIQGYEHVLLSDGSFLVPLLYPVAKRLVPAAKAARADGYTLKIYDSFRPYVATRSIYDLTYQCLNYIVPASTFTRIYVGDYMQGSRASVLSLNSLTKAPSPEELASMTDAEQATHANDTTYQKVMLNNGAYNLGAFLAAKGSMHNVGVAMDMTIVDTASGEELKAQSRMHDLSWYSVQASNNENANILKKYMEAEGFNMITSEWWHFQDNTARNELQPVSVANGVSIEGWKKDDKGWKYQLADGTFIIGKSEDLGGKSYSFDKDGYVTE